MKNPVELIGELLSAYADLSAYAIACAAKGQAPTLEGVGQLMGALDPLQEDIVAVVNRPPSPTVVCLCGSTRFGEAFQVANLTETLNGKIVLTIGCDLRSDEAVFVGYSEEQLKEVKRRLDFLHFRKIDLSDEVLILNVGGYIGESTSRELAYAREQGKRVRFLESEMQEVTSGINN